MSEQRGTYNVGATAPATLMAFKQRRCVLPYAHPDYQPPTPEEVDALVKLAGWSQNDAAKLTGVTYNPKKGSSTIRKWRANSHSTDYREIPYSAWRLFLLYAGVVSVADDLVAIKSVN